MVYVIHNTLYITFTLCVVPLWGKQITLADTVSGIVYHVIRMVLEFIQLRGITSIEVEEAAAFSPFSFYV